MHYRDFGSTGWKVSEISFGGWQIGGQWGPVDDETSVRSLLYAFEKGVNLVDTAEYYGDGHSEEVIGEALRRWDGDKVYVATKVRPVSWPAPEEDDPLMRGRYPEWHLRDAVEKSLTPGPVPRRRRAEAGVHRPGAVRLRLADRELDRGHLRHLAPGLGAGLAVPGRAVRPDPRACGGAEEALRALLPDTRRGGAALHAQRRRRLDRDPGNADAGGDRHERRLLRRRSLPGRAARRASARRRSAHARCSRRGEPRGAVGVGALHG